MKRFVEDGRGNELSKVEQVVYSTIYYRQPLMCLVSRHACELIHNHKDTQVSPPDRSITNSAFISYDRDAIRGTTADNSGDLDFDSTEE